MCGNTQLGATSVRDTIDRETGTDNIAHTVDTARLREEVLMIPETLQNVKLLGYLNLKQKQAFVRNL